MNNEKNLHIEILPAFLNNYIFVGKLEDLVFVVDPGSHIQVLKYLKSKSLQLNYILITHHHHDHTGGIQELKKLYPDAIVIYPEKEKKSIPNYDSTAKKEFYLNNLLFQTISLPGHTIGHIGFYLPEFKILFCGDVLFSAGCGRIFEGTYEEMFESLQKIKKLPLDVKIYCAHEYTLQNLKFATTIEPENKDIKLEIQNAKKLLSRSIPTVPTTLEKELKINPFLRTNNINIINNLNLKSVDEFEIFTNIRKMKDKFS